eukprot:140576_1
MSETSKQGLLNESPSIIHSIIDDETRNSLLQNARKSIDSSRTTISIAYSIVTRQQSLCIACALYCRLQFGIKLRRKCGFNIMKQTQSHKYKKNESGERHTNCDGTNW